MLILRLYWAYTRGDHELYCSELYSIAHYLYWSLYWAYTQKITSYTALSYTRLHITYTGPYTGLILKKITSYTALSYTRLYITYTGPYTGLILKKITSYTAWSYTALILDSY